MFHLMLAKSVCTSEGKNKEKVNLMRQNHDSYWKVISWDLGSDYSGAMLQLDLADVFQKDS